MPARTSTRLLRYPATLLIVLTLPRQRMHVPGAGNRPAPEQTHPGSTTGHALAHTHPHRRWVLVLLYHCDGLHSLHLSQQEDIMPSRHPPIRGYRSAPLIGPLPYSREIVSLDPSNDVGQKARQGCLQQLHFYLS